MSQRGQHLYLLVREPAKPNSELRVMGLDGKDMQVCVQTCITAWAARLLPLAKPLCMLNVLAVFVYTCSDVQVSGYAG